MARAGALKRGDRDPVCADDAAAWYRGDGGDVTEELDAAAGKQRSRSYKRDSVTALGAIAGEPAAGSVANKRGEPREEKWATGKNAPCAIDGADAATGT